MTTLTIPHLRPLTAGQILDRGIRLYRHHFGVFVAIAAVLQIPVVLMQGLGTGLALSDSFMLVQLSSFFSLGASFLSVFVTVVGSGVMAWMITASWSGQKIGFAAAFQPLLSRIGDLVVTMIIIFTALIALLVWTIVGIIVGWCTGPGMIWYFMAALMPLTGPIFMLEKRAGFDVLRRAWDLSRRRFWQVLGFVIVLTLFIFAITIGPTLLITYLVSFVLSGFDPSAPFGLENMPGMTSLWGVLVQTATTYTLQTLLVPVQWSAIVVLYLDLRIRTEGLDLELVTALSNKVVDTNWETFLADAPAPRKDSLIVSDEWIYFGGITLFFIALVVVFTIIVGAVASAVLLPIISSQL